MTELPPHNPDAERAVLGAMLSSDAIAQEALGLVDADDFYDLGCQALFRTCGELADVGTAIDVITVCNALRQSGHGDRVVLAQTVVSEIRALTNWMHHAEIVLDYSQRRRDRAHGLELVAAASNGGVSHERRLQLTAELQRQRTPPAADEPLSWADVLDMPAELVPWLVEGLVRKGSLGSLVALPKVGKSLLAMELGVKVAQGRGSVLGCHVLQQAPVLYYWQDDDEIAYKERVDAFHQAHRLTRALPFQFRLNKGYVLPDCLPTMRADIERAGAGLAFLDTFYQFTRHGVNLKDEEAADLLKLVKSEIVDQTGCTVMALDHAPWPNEANGGNVRAYGSVFKTGATRFSILMDRKPDDEIVTIRVGGNNRSDVTPTRARFDDDRQEFIVVEDAYPAGDVDASILEFLRKHGKTQTNRIYDTKKNREALGMSHHTCNAGLGRLEKAGRVYKESGVRGAVLWDLTLAADLEPTSADLGKGDVGTLALPLRGAEVASVALTSARDVGRAEDAAG